MRYLRSALSLILPVWLAACSHSSSAPDKSKFALYAATIPPITVPAGIKNPTEESYYPIPPVALKAPFGVKPPLEPPGSHILIHKSKVSLPKPVVSTNS